tara:strand:+ start:136 stop:1044 length:909 start_codon:yes stop_codon:yes gene_type:complete
VSWIQLQWQLQSDQVAEAETLLSDHGATAVVLESLADEVVLEPDPGATPIWQSVRVKALFRLDLDVAELGAALKDLDPQLHDHCEFDFIAEQDWQAVLSQQAVERCFANRLWLLPKSAATDPRPERIACLYLDPGLAFGSGSHPTTRMCLSYLAEAVQPGQRILDFGCGSGILAIAAALLGATAVGVDHDDQAVLATTENARFNEVSMDQLQVFNLQHWHQNVGSSAESFDMISANILAGPLQQLAEHFCGLLKSGGQVVLSGILPHQVQGVIDAYPWIDFVNPVIEDDWACLIGTKHLNVR